MALRFQSWESGEANVAGTDVGCSRNMEVRQGKACTSLWKCED